MTDIIDIPENLPISPFPVLGSSNYNQEAYDNGITVPPAIARMREIAVACRTNAVAAKEFSQATSGSVAQASAQADRAANEANAAMGYRNTAGTYAATATTKATEAASSASAAAADRVQTGNDRVSSAANAKRAEDAAASIAGGPITSLSVYSGVKTGAVVLGLSDLGAQATDAQMKAGSLTTPLLMSPANVKAGAKETTRINTAQRNSNTKIVVADLGIWFSATGSFTQTIGTPAELGSGWFCYYQNSGYGVVVISAEINGFSSFSVYPGQTFLIKSNGSSFNAVIVSGSEEFIAIDEKPFNTAGQSIPNESWTLRVLNTVTKNTINGASLSANRVVVPAGVYSINSYSVNGGIDSPKGKFTTRISSSSVVYGTGISGQSLYNVNNNAVCECVANIESSTSIGIECFGQGVNGGYSNTLTGNNEIYSLIHIRKIG